MANSSDDLADRYSDGKQKLKIISKQLQDNGSSSAPSSGDDDIDDLDDSPNLSIQQAQSLYPVSSSQGKKSKKRAVWELIEGYRDPNVVVQKPKNHEGILLKRRNWPMKGWHKRYFILIDGILTYGKSKADLTKNKDKPHGIVNAYLSIVSYISSKRRILIDSSTNSSAVVCHLKAKTQGEFDAWLDALKQHRLYYQYKLSHTTINRNSSYQMNSSLITSINQNNGSSVKISSLESANPNNNSSISNFSKISSSDDVAKKNFQINLKIDHEVKTKQKSHQILDENQLDNNFKQVEESLMNLSRGLTSLYLCTLSSSTNTVNTSNQQINNSGQMAHLSTFVPHHQPQPSTVSADFVHMLNSNSKIHSSKSNPNLINDNGILNPSLGINNTNTSNILNSASNAVSNLVTAGTMVLNVPPTISINTAASVSSPKISQKNHSTNSIATNYGEENLYRQLFYQDAKSIHDQLIFLYQQLLLKKQNLLSNNSNMHKSLSRSERSQSVMSSVSLQDSQLQFYDAIEYFTSDSESDDDSDQDSEIENNEPAKPEKHAIVPEELQSQKMLTRRRKLPAIAPDTSQVSVWGILRKAIGKDLSKISLPVILNEPLSILQRLCEELEYSDLLDIASTLSDPYDRMVYIAAFIISGYSSSYYRNGAKNFNPLLGETYELIRPDKGWKYIAEQVSHHPPISSCNCQSKNFIHEQVFHAKIKFWGKSMEVHPEGYTRLTLPKFNEIYQWNKIVMYVHNVMGSSRKVEQYGEITIRSTNGVICTINFPKSSNSSQKNEFFGEVIHNNIVKRKIFGQWHESFLCGMDNTAKTIWRMGAMPEDFNLYYGFTRFAIELNELSDDIKDDIPPTDARFRPDQRNLENGDVENAEIQKHRIEEKQRNRRKEMEAKGEIHQPLWFNLSKDSLKTSTNEEKEWIFNDQYWTKRENQGFKNMKNMFPNLW